MVTNRKVLTRGMVIAEEDRRLLIQELADEVVAGAGS